MNALQLLLAVLVYIGGTELFHGDLREGNRFLWPVAALIIGVRKMVKALKGLFAQVRSGAAREI